ncbi:hypothetical protein F2P81_010513 [Scophthalmus maximus]|uniref:Uncharacterized protein n=1 Tax=Scophthalmus maximus TaxID=52904 RepID=A0A6A4SY22_SCOMX|nr:hypothetical protein F2P81_010513 [Scophthalmus maximus]
MTNGQKGRKVKKEKVTQHNPRTSNSDRTQCGTFCEGGRSSTDTLHPPETRPTNTATFGNCSVLVNGITQIPVEQMNFSYSHSVQCQKVGKSKQSLFKGGNRRLTGGSQRGDNRGAPQLLRISIAVTFCDTKQRDHHKSVRFAKCWNKTARGRKPLSPPTAIDFSGKRSQCS